MWSALIVASTLLAGPALAQDTTETDETTEESSDQSKKSKAAASEGPQNKRESSPAIPPEGATGGLTFEQWRALPAKLTYEPGMVVPDHYTLHRRPLTGLAVAGGSMLGAGYLFSLPFAVTDSLLFDGRLWPMFIPVVGPFAAIATFQPFPEGAGVLIFDGVLQVAGLTMMIAGVAIRTERLERNPFSGLKASIGRTEAGGNQLVLSGRF